ncbi:AMP-binding protein [Blattabacterium cuenoti]|uniref:AMP-binding protein n=1 Tax=Blattabacterium cuenoti TaxID=1653831 RepID=UPI00163CD409|nr:AMP-binding protein [Blattabacterium cuenoti]
MWLDFSYKKIFSSKKLYSSFWKRKIFSFLEEWYNKNTLLTIYTSGTTGVPKKIFVKKQHMYEKAIQSVEFLKIKKKKIIGLLCLSTDFIAAKMFLVRAIIFKWKIYCVPPSSNPLKNVKYNFDIVSMVPIQVFFSFKHLKNVKILLIGGCSISNFLEKKLQNITTICYDTYGMTETLGHIALKKINGLNKSIFYKSFKDVHLSIDKRNCLGIFSKSMNFFIQTNDIVHMISKDRFRWIGRYDHIINSGGIKVVPELIEKDINPFIPCNKRFFISSIPDKILGEKIVLVIEGDFFPLTIPKFIFNGEKKFYKPKKVFFISHFTKNLLEKFNRKKIIKQINKN